jgi:ribosome-binding protein aMBF1 (putative translation factor)
MPTQQNKPLRRSTAVSSDYDSLREWAFSQELNGSKKGQARRRGRPASDDSQRRKVVGRTIRELRGALGVDKPISQHELAARIHKDVEGSSVSRWERGVIMPHALTRRKLARLAETCGRSDLANAFLRPGDWRAAFRQNLPLEAEFLTLLEVCALNGEALESEENWGIATAMDDLRLKAYELLDLLLAAESSGENILLADDAHRLVWSSHRDAYKNQTKGRTDDTGTAETASTEATR